MTLRWNTLLTLLLVLLGCGEVLAQKNLNAGQNKSFKSAPTKVELRGTSELGSDAKYGWTLVAGPGPVKIENAAALETAATVGDIGAYVFRLTGRKGTTTETDDVTFDVFGDGDEERGSEISGYLGEVFDNFIASEQRTYLNKNLAEVSGGTDNRFLFGFNADFRLFAKEERQLWFYLETLHGVRSADVDCTQPEEDKRPAICGGPDTDPTKLNKQAHYILKNASSVEGFAGFRFEFLPLQLGSSSPVSLYAKGQLGFMAVAKNPGDMVDNHFVGLGLIATAGRFRGSYFDAGWGRTDLFNVKRLDRWKYDAYVTFKVSQTKGLSWFKPFFQMTVDSDFGGGADSIQSYMGFNFDLTALK